MDRNKDTAEIVFMEQLANQVKGILLETPKTFTHWAGTCSEHFYSIQVMGKNRNFLYTPTYLAITRLIHYRICLEREETRS